MTVQFSTPVRNAQLDAIEATIGTGAILKIYTGAEPANVAASRTGTVVATMNLPSDYFANASSGSKAKLGTWEDTSADASGTAGYWTLFASDGTTAGAQGNCTATGGGGDMTLDNVTLVAGQDVLVTGFTLTAGNA